MRVTLLGHTLWLRPDARTFTYLFGDGEDFGPTTDPGGTYPTGEVRHTYRDTGHALVQIEAGYTGDYSLDGHTWQPIDITVPVRGPATPLQIKQAHAHLVADPH